jgi:NAD-reducing hydrogenase small subunit
MGKIRLATAWLGGCSGCHMSFLDLDEKLIELAPLIEMVYGPLVDAKVFPPDVDVALVEGAVITEDNRHLLQQIRERSKLVVALGDCAVTGNVPGMRNPMGREAVTSRAYLELTDWQAQIPAEVVAPLVKSVRPLHRECAIDFFVPGCPPNARRIYFVLSELLNGRTPQLEEDQRMFG